MSQDHSGGTQHRPSPARTRPTIRQFTVFSENRGSQLIELLKRFEHTGVRIVALSVADVADCSLIRLLLNRPEDGREILERAGLAIIETELLGVELPDDHRSLIEVCKALVQANIEIIQAYPLLVRPRGRPVVAFMLSDIETALQTLDLRRFGMITESDLAAEL